jgi:hypothetical protein
MENSLLQHKKQHDAWYKEPWLLLVAGGPLFVVCASITTGIIAWRGSDKVVAADYYKQGLMINTDIHRDAKARAMALHANIQFDAVARTIKMVLQGNTNLPDVVQISLASADSNANSVSEVVRRLPMTQIQSGVYIANLPEAKTEGTKPLGNNKLLHIKVETTDWRLTGDWFDPEQRQAELKAIK